MSKYASPGHAYLVCPVLLELDPRHGRHWSKHPACAHGRDCIASHEHEAHLVDGGGHRVADFYWPAGGDHIQAHFDCRDGCHDDLRCGCGRQLVHADLDDPFAAGV